VDGAPEFAQWLDGERTRLTSLAVLAAGSEAKAQRAKGDLPQAITAAEFACAQSPDDERVFRQYLALLMDAGDHATARRAYDGFARRLHAEFEVAPAPETAAVLEGLRQSSASPVALQPFVGPDDSQLRLEPAAPARLAPRR
jgi:DNA-binding SARP family transcriptional activator